jgi:hypothetical protein
MCDRQTYSDRFTANIKSSILVGGLHGPHDRPNLRTAKKALGRVMSGEYHRQMDDRRELRQQAINVGDGCVIEATQSSLDSARSWTQHMFAAGYSRFNKAADAYENQTITIDFDKFDPEKFNDGELNPDEMGVQDGDYVPIAHSDSGNSYTLYEKGEQGYLCSCYDKVNNDIFPVCKHEMLWLLTQILLYNRGIHGIISVEALGTLSIADSGEYPSDDDDKKDGEAQFIGIDPQ